MSLTHWVRGRVCLAAGISVLLALACLSPALARAQTNYTFKTVNCDTPGVADFNSIHQALNNTDSNGLLELEVTGTCHERPVIGDGTFARNSVYIHPPGVDRATITLVGTPGEGTGNVLQICGAHGIFLERLDISGGNNGVLVCDASEVDFFDVTIENNTAVGVYATGNSKFDFQSSRIRNNGAVGVDLGILQGSSKVSFLGGNVQGGPQQNVIEGNGQFGVNAGVGAVAHFGGANLVRNNGGATTATTHGGIHATRTSAVQIQASASGASTEITSNVGPGILAEVNSSVSLQGANIHDNSEQGVRLRTQSVLELVGQDTFTANGIANITCDAWSLLTGDTTAVKRIDCSNIDIPPKK